MPRKVLIALKMSVVAGQEKLNGVFAALDKKHDWDIRLVRNASELTGEVVREALDEGLDGAIVSIPGTEKAACALAEAGVPLVVMDLHDPTLTARRQNVVFVRNSGESIGRAAAHYFMRQGIFKSYGFLHVESLAEWSVSRCQAFRKTLSDGGCWLDELHDVGEIASLRRPAALLVANDDRAYAVLEYCRAHAIRVPRDVAVLGINNDTVICEHSQPRLSSLQPDFREEGRLAAKTLAEMMRATAPYPAKTLFVGVRQIVRRQSTVETSPSGKLVQRAALYIQKNALSGIDVRDVVRHLKVSRRLADLRYRELTGESMLETILAIRLNETKKLLLTSAESTTRIAARVGYADTPNALRNLFKKRIGISMTDYRRKNSSF